MRTDPVRVLEEIKRLAVEQLGAVPAGLYAPIAEILHESSMRSGLPGGRRLDEQSLLLMRQHSATYTMRFRQLIAQGFDDFRALRIRHAGDLPLGLVAENQLQFHLAGQRLAEAIEQRYGKPLEQMTHSLELLSNALDVPQASNPIGANRLAAAFIETFRDVNMPDTLQPLVFRQYEQELAHNASHDLLTGLPNRSLLGDRLRQSFSISRRHAQKVAVLFIDLDGFKLINDSLGHLSGDEALKLVSGRIVAQTRPGDTLARIGGDEFVLLVPDVQDDAQLPQLARRILTTIAQPIKLQGQQVQLTASIGISVSGIELTEPMQLVQQADLAMYRAKQLGRNNYQWYDAEMDQSLSKQLSLKAMLRKAIEQQELELYYQPQVDAVTNELVGLEALLRWPHPEQGFISPDEFIPVAEDTGMIVEIGQWVLEQACTFNYQLQQKQLAFVPVAVNLSSMQFQRSEFIEQLQQTLLAQQLAPRYLELELTESLLLENIEYVIEKLHQLKQLGISIAIDDFGTGYSSLNYLKRLPIDKLKIDRSFVRDIVSDQRDAAICRAIIAMAHQLNIKVVAEGVEHDAQVALLRKSVCDEFQGYHFAKPMSAQDTEQFLRHYTAKQQQRQDGSKQTLLLVDDEANILHALKRLLRKEPYQVLTCTSAKQAFELLALHDIQVILSDQRMPQMNGTEFLSQVKTMYPDTVRLVLSGYTDLRSVTDAINRGAIYKFLTKPWQDDSLREEIRAAFKRYAEQRHKTQP